jgi:hypothetical protein
LLGKGQPEFDVLADKALQHFFDPLHNRVQVCRVRIEDLLSAEGEKPLGEVRGPVSGREYLLEVAPGGIVFRHAHLKQCSEADDGAEDIVEIVGNPAGKLSDSLHLLCLPQQGLKVFLFFLPDTQ